MNQKANPSGFGADFGAYVPGFDFLQKLAQGDPQALYASWIAPTLDPKVLDQRIGELKAVLFWLEQNGAALKATLQALEVQKMTLAALRSMGSMSASMPGAQPGAEGRASASGAPDAAHAFGTSGMTGTSAPGADPAAPPFMADAMQYWAALTQQFQTIATQALQDVAARGAAAAAAATPSGPAPSAAGPSDEASAPPRAKPRKAARPGGDDPKPHPDAGPGPNP